MSIFEAPPRWRPIGKANPNLAILQLMAVAGIGADSVSVDELPECLAGELLLIKASGAYGSSMASTCNSRPLAAEVLLQNGRYAVVRRRQHFEEMIAGEQPARNWGTP